MSSDTLTLTFAEIRLRLWSMASRMLGNNDDANDALQDAFCQLWQRKECIKSRSEAEAMSVVTVRNRCIDSLRRQSRTSTVSIDENREAEDIPSEHESSSREELYNHIRMIIDSRLSPLQQKIIKLRDIENKSYTSIAEHLDMNESAVRMQLSRARKIVRDYYNSIKHD